MAIGGGLSSKIKSLSFNKLRTKSKDPTKLGKIETDEIKTLKTEALQICSTFDNLLERYQLFDPGRQEIIDYLEFGDPEFYEAFKHPEEKNLPKVTRKKGQSVGPLYLFKRWQGGDDAGILRDWRNVKEHPEIWDMSLQAREGHVAHWKDEMMKDLIGEICDVGVKYSDTLGRMEAILQGEVLAVLQNKRVIGCTTATWRSIVATLWPLTEASLLSKKLRESWKVIS